MERIHEYKRAREAFEQALQSYDHDDLVSEQRLYNAAKAFARADYPGPEAATRAIARIHKRRWRRDATDLASLVGYLTYLGQFGDRRLRKDRIAGARLYERVTSILTALAAVPAHESFVQLMTGLCQRAATQYLIAELPLRATPLADLALGYARSFVMWDKQRTYHLVAPLKLASQVALANLDYSRVIECQTELLLINPGWGPLKQDEKQFSHAAVRSSRDELVLFFEARSRFEHFTRLSGSDRDTALTFAHRIPVARDLGENLRLLGQAHAGAGDTAAALKAFDAAVNVLTSELASEQNRLLALDIVLEAIEVCVQRDDRAECARRAREGVVEAEALKAHGASVPQLPKLLARIGDLSPE